MTMTVAIRRRRTLARKGIGMPGDNTRILALARRLSGELDAITVGGIAVYLHGVVRATADLDLYTTDRAGTAEQLELLGARWSKAQREHTLDGVAIHTITPEDAGITIERASIIDGIRVASLKDLIAIKLISGLTHRGRSKDLGDVEELIRAVPLDKRFAAKLPAKIRKEFKAVVEAVRGHDRDIPRRRRF